MREILDDIVATWRRGEPAGLATVTATWSSAPRQAGAAMLVRADGTAAGSVSGGCVESAVYELCREVAGSGAPRTARYGVTDDDAAQVGLPCGGTIEVFVETGELHGARSAGRRGGRRAAGGAADLCGRPA
ncbi:XdhC family protein [Actinoplanes friuliensis]|uniref:XdhC family protein n=1 Tax=Actinoplanes friuliensis TaxID=196914 RepID=UPI0003FD8EF8|nr:XdhC family protein [Actinoplanes friuliensis]